MAAQNETTSVRRRGPDGKDTKLWIEKITEKRIGYIMIKDQIQKFDEDMADAYRAAITYLDDLMKSRNEEEDANVEKKFRAQFPNAIWVEELPHGGSLLSPNGVKKLIEDISRVKTQTKCFLTHEYGLVSHDLEGGDEFDCAIEEEEEQRAAKENLHRTDGKYEGDFDVPDFKNERNAEIAKMMEEIALDDQEHAEKENGLDGS